MRSVLTTYLLLFAFVPFCSGQSFDGKPKTDADPSVKEFLAQLDADDPEQVETVLGTVSSLGYLGQVNRQKVEKRLVDLLEAPTASVRIMAASALNLIDGPLDRAIQVLIEVAVTTPKIWPLRDGKRMYAEGDASYAISTLGYLGERAAICVPTLIELLKSEDMGVHINSIDALGQIGIAASIAVPALEKELLDSESFFHPWGPRGGDYASAHAAKALGLIGRTAFPVLDHALSHPDYCHC